MGNGRVTIRDSNVKIPAYDPVINGQVDSIPICPLIEVIIDGLFLVFDIVYGLCRVRRSRFSGRDRNTLGTARKKGRLRGNIGEERDL